MRKDCFYIIIFHFIYLILSIFILYILSYLVRLRTFRLSAWVGADINAGVHARGEDVTITDVTINPQIENKTGDVNDVMPGSDELGFLVILNKSSKLIWTKMKWVDFSDLARGRSSCLLWGAHARLLGQMKQSA